MNKDNIFEYIMLTFGMVYMIFGSYLAYNGNYLVSAQVYASGALLFSLFSWREVCRLKRILKERDNEN